MVYLLSIIVYSLLIIFNSFLISVYSFLFIFNSLLIIVHPFLIFFLYFKLLYNSLSSCGLGVEARIGMLEIVSSILPCAHPLFFRRKNRRKFPVITENFGWSRKTSVT
jgi:hypothetical protein